jgi:hypothetical protein
MTQRCQYEEFNRHRRVGSLSKIDVDDQLPFDGMAGNMTFARRIFRKHDAACGKSADVTIARLVSNSTSPVSQITSIRCGGLCQLTSHMPEGM